MPSPEIDIESFTDTSKTLSELYHVYDAAKAHEYYLRVRKLKGRSRQGDATTNSRVKTGASTSAKRLHSKPAKTQTNQKRRAEAKARVDALNARLDKLRSVLAELVKQAKARSGVETTTKKTTSSSSTSSSSTTKTASQKRDDAKRSAEYRKKNEPKTNLSTEAKAVEAKIKQVKAQIEKMRAELATAKKKVQIKESNTKSKRQESGNKLQTASKGRSDKTKEGR